jgi:hypothetical protein
MIKRPKIMFLMYDECIVHGGFFDNFEYYYITKQVFKDCDVTWRCITSHTKDEVLALLQEKYQDIEPKVWKDIEVCKHTMKKFWKNPLIVDVLICATNSAMFWFLEHGNIQAAKTYIGLADWKDIHPLQNKYYKNSFVLGDERIFNNVIPYRKKILFDRFKQEDKFGAEYDHMLNLSLKERRFPKEWIMELFEEFGYGRVTFAAYSGFKNSEYYSYFKDLDMVYLVTPPFDSFMDMFNYFIYVPYRDGTDATPRIIPECEYYGKEVFLYNRGFEHIKSGGYYRYQDTMDDFFGLWLKEDDKIMEYIDKCLSL